MFQTYIGATVTALVISLLTIYAIYLLKILVLHDNTKITKIAYEKTCSDICVAISYEVNSGRTMKCQSAKQ